MNSSRNSIWQRVGKSGSVFDIKKFEWLNSHYINQLDVLRRGRKQSSRFGGKKVYWTVQRRIGIWLEGIVEAVGERLTTLKDIVPQTSYFFTDAFEYEPKAVKKWWGNSEEKSGREPARF